MADAQSSIATGQDEIITGRVTRLYPSQGGTNYFHLAGQREPYGFTGTYIRFTSTEQHTWELLLAAAQNQWVVTAVVSPPIKGGDVHLRYVYVDFPQGTGSTTSSSTTPAL